MHPVADSFLDVEAAVWALGWLAEEQLAHQRLKVLVHDSRVEWQQC